MKWIFNKIIIIPAIAIIILFPIIINFTIMNWSTEFTFGESGHWLTFISTYYGAVIGGLISGLFTYLGVKITLDKKTEERKTRERMLFTQLRFTYNMFTKLPEDVNAQLGVEYLVYDNDWNKHITFIDGLSKAEFRLIINWFYCMNQLQVMSKGNNGAVKSEDAKKLIGGHISGMERLLIKYNY